MGSVGVVLASVQGCPHYPVWSDMPHNRIIIRETELHYKPHHGEDPPAIPLEPIKMVGPKSVASLLDHVAWYSQEEFYVIGLDSRHMITYLQMVSRGTVSASLVHPREVFRQAIHCNSVAIVIAHNHPSGSPIPSNEDDKVTQRLVDAGALLGIRVVDHIVLGLNENTTAMAYYSYDEEGRMPSAMSDTEL